MATFWITAPSLRFGVLLTLVIPKGREGTKEEDDVEGRFEASGLAALAISDAPPIARPSGSLVWLDDFLRIDWPGAFGESERCVEPVSMRLGGAKAYAFCFFRSSC